MSRPKLIAHNLASLDGRLTTAPDSLLLSGNPLWEKIAGTEDTYAHLIQLFQPQAILEGSGSFALPDSPPAILPATGWGQSELHQDYLTETIVKQPGRKWFTVVDSRGRVEWMYKEFPGEAWSGFHLLVLVSQSTPDPYLAFLQNQQIPYLVAGETQVDLSLAFGKMSRLLGVETIVSTAGGRLHGALLRAGLIDEIYLILAPALIGGLGTPSLFDAPPLKEGELPVFLELLRCEVTKEQMVKLHYRVKKEDV